MNLNKAFVAGRLTADPQLRTTPSGQSVLSFSLATNRNWTDKAGARQEAVEYHNIVAWGKQAEIGSQFLSKGSLVLVEGRLQTRSWQDKQGGQRKTTEIICERMQFGPRSSGGGSGFRSSTQPGFKSSESEPSSKDVSVEEIPVIDIDSEIKEDIKPEDLPF
ncbi:MAG: single-stranded DNA-binding protein [Candidatus Liptonbacteria bacterium]|nr:single-stranded DNA-binding protein [Candidatus Liptonbacteria bacterium]